MSQSPNNRKAGHPVLQSRAIRAFLRPPPHRRLASAAENAWRGLQMAAMAKWRAAVRAAVPEIGELEDRVYKLEDQIGDLMSQSQVEELIDEFMTRKDVEQTLRELGLIDKE